MEERRDRERDRSHFAANFAPRTASNSHILQNAAAAENPKEGRREGRKEVEDSRSFQPRRQLFSKCAKFREQPRRIGIWACEGDTALRKIEEAEEMNGTVGCVLAKDRGESDTKRLESGRVTDAEGRLEEGAMGSAMLFPWSKTAERRAPTSVPGCS